MVKLSKPLIFFPSDLICSFISCLHSSSLVADSQASVVLDTVLCNSATVPSAVGIDVIVWGWKWDSKCCIEMCCRHDSCSVCVRTRACTARAVRVGMPADTAVHSWPDWQVCPVCVHAVLHLVHLVSEVRGCTSLVFPPSNHRPQPLPPRSLNFFFFIRIFDL